jgi:hypothetical protein
MRKKNWKHVDKDGENLRHEFKIIKDSSNMKVTNLYGVHAQQPRRMLPF